jgi:hypothetical protein
VHADLEQVTAPPKAGHVPLDHEQTEPATRVRHCTCDDDEKVAELAVGDVGLRAVQNPTVAAARGARANAGQVAAGIGLRHRDPEVVKRLSTARQNT